MAPEIRHPAELDGIARHMMAMLILRRGKVNVRRVYAVDVDRIAFVDGQGRARTAMLIGTDVEAPPRVVNVRVGWPV